MQRSRPGSLIKKNCWSECRWRQQALELALLALRMSGGRRMYNFAGEWLLRCPDATDRAELSSMFLHWLPAIITWPLSTCYQIMGFNYGFLFSHSFVCVVCYSEPDATPRWRHVCAILRFTPNITNATSRLHCLVIHALIGAGPFRWEAPQLHEVWRVSYFQ